MSQNKWLAACFLIGVALAAAGCSTSKTATGPAVGENVASAAVDEITKPESPARDTTEKEFGLLPVPTSDAEWHQRLTPEQYHICREKGTERPYKNALWDNHRAGRYLCVGCGLPLFTSTTKFESGTGWPSFWSPVAADAVREHDDNSGFGHRIEVTCRRCGSHLGHVFNDGPAEHTGLRYCMNSAALKFSEPKETGR